MVKEFIEKQLKKFYIGEALFESVAAAKRSYRGVVHMKRR